MSERNIIVGEDLERTIFSSLGELASAVLQAHGENVLQIDAETGEKLSANLIMNRCVALTEWLRNEGIRPGDIISVNSENRLEFCLVPLSTFFVGATFAPFNPDYTPDELSHVANLSKPKIIFCSEKTIDKMVSMLQRLPFVKKLVLFGSGPVKSNAVVMFDEIMKGVREGPVDPNFKVTEIDPDETVATIMCSSGTTGLPKGVMTTHANITYFMEIGRAIVQELFDGDQKRMTIGLMPFFHSMGLMSMFLNLMAGNTNIVLNKFRPKLFLESIQKYRITHLVVPPPILIFLTKNLSYEYDLSSLIDVRSGAAPMSKDMEIDVKSKLKLQHTSQAYGMTETTLGVLITRTDNLRIGSVGQIVPGMSVKVIDENGTPLEAYQEGELCFKGPLIMKGYIGDEKATRIAIDKDNWLHTGDVAYYDNDGFFFIVDRIKELIKYKAFQVAPAELEGILLTHPAVLDAAVIGLPNEEAGELPLAYVVKKPNVKVTEKELEDFIAAKVSPQKKLRGGVHFINEIPKNPTGKILRRILKQQAIKMKSKL